jgi:hypothetical protein
MARKNRRAVETAVRTRKTRFGTYLVDRETGQTVVRTRKTA